MDKAPDAFRTISEVAGELEVPQHVLRFWESRFREIKPMKRGGGRRYYRPDDVSLLRGIRHLLYGEGYTIRGVQRILKEQGAKFVQTVWQPGAPQPAHRAADETDFAPDDADAKQSVHDGGDRGRGLFSLLPKLLADSDTPPPPKMPPELREKPPSAPGERIVPPLSAPAGMSRENFRRLQAALQDLAQCRDLLNGAISETA